MGAEISTAVTAIRTEIVNVVSDITGVDFNQEEIKKTYRIRVTKMHYTVVQTHHFACPVTFYDVAIFTWYRAGSADLYTRGDITTHAAYPTEYDALQEINPVWGDYGGS